MLRQGATYIRVYQVKKRYLNFIFSKQERKSDNKEIHVTGFKGQNNNANLREVAKIFAKMGKFFQTPGTFHEGG